MIAALFAVVIVLASGWITHALLSRLAIAQERSWRHDAEDAAADAEHRLDEQASR